MKRLSLACMLVVELATCAFAQSRSSQSAPAVRPPVAPDQRGTPSTPVIVQVQPSPPTAAALAEEQRRKDQEAADRASTGRLAVATVFVGLLQVIAIAFQAVIAWRQNKITADQNTIMTNQTALMNGQLVATQHAATAAGESADAAKASIALTHRPRIVVRNVDVPGIRIGDYSTGTVWATNVGNALAKVIRFDATWFVGHELPMSNPYLAPGITKEKKRILVSGNSRTFVLPAITDSVKDSVSLHDAIHEDVGRPGVPSLYVFGVLKYRDSADSNLRKTGFCRRYDRRTGRFHAVVDADYEFDE